MTQKEKDIIAKRYTENESRSVAMSNAISEFGEHGEYGIIYPLVRLYDVNTNEDGAIASMLGIHDYCREYSNLHRDELITIYTTAYKNMINNNSNK